MQFWHGTVVADGYHTTQTEVWKHAYGNDYGHGPHGKYNAIWNVPVNGKPHCCIGYCCCHGSIDTYAVCSCYYGSLGTSRASKSYGAACTDQQRQVHVHMGWTDLRCQSQRKYDDSRKVIRSERFSYFTIHHSLFTISCVSSGDAYPSIYKSQERSFQHEPHCDRQTASYT